MSKVLKIAIEEKTFQLNGRAIPILSDFNIELAAGEFVCLLGPSGCGKTTLLRLILGLDTDYRGEIILNNKRIEGPGADRGIVFQEPRLLPWMTVRENIEFAIPANTDRARLQRHALELISLVGLGGFENAWPNQLSGGMAQRCALARALVTVPGLLLLDEPFGSLDNFTRYKMQAELRSLHAREGITTLLVTHDVDEAVYLSDRIIILQGQGMPYSTLNVPDHLPRDRKNTDFTALRSKLLEKLHQ